MVLRNLMEHGIRDATGQLVGKTIIFARGHDHAVLLQQLFDELYQQFGGRFCQVIDNYDPRAEKLIDDFTGDGTNPDLARKRVVEGKSVSVRVGICGSRISKKKNANKQKKR